MPHFIRPMKSTTNSNQRNKFLQILPEAAKFALLRLKVPKIAPPITPLMLEGNTDEMKMYNINLPPSYPLGMG